jgi:hypothetical protein
MKKLLAIVGAIITGGLAVVVSIGSQLAHAAALN